MNNKEGLFSIHELIRLMLECDGTASFENWGLCVRDSNFCIEQESEKSYLLVSLLDIVDFSDEEYPDFGREELFFLFGDKGEHFEWGIVCFNKEAEGSREMNKQLMN